MRPERSEGTPMIIQSLITGHRSAIRHRPPALGPRRISVIVAGTVVGVVAVWGRPQHLPGRLRTGGPTRTGACRPTSSRTSPGLAVTVSGSSVSSIEVRRGVTPPAAPTRIGPTRSCPRRCTPDSPHRPRAPAETPAPSRAAAPRRAPPRPTGRSLRSPGSSR